MASQDNTFTVLIGPESNPKATGFLLRDFETKSYLFKFIEYQYVKVYNFSKNYILQFETEEEQKDGSYFKEVGYNKGVVINNNDSKKGAMAYKVRAINKKTNLVEFENIYLVEPLAATGSGNFYSMLNYITEYNEVICYDPTKSKLSSPEMKKGHRVNYSKATSKMIADNYKFILSNLNRAIRNVGELKANLTKSRRAKKVNAKAIIKTALNNSFDYKDYSIQKDINYDLEDYQSLYAMLYISKVNLENNIDKSVKYIANVKLNIQNLKIEYEDNLPPWLIDYENQQSISIANIEKINECLKALDLQLIHSLNVLNDLLSKPKFVFNPSKSFLLNKYNNQLYLNLYLPFINTQRHIFKNFRDVVSSPLFETSKIFEILVLVKYIEAIEDAGYISTGIDFKDLEGTDLINKVEFVFIRGKKKILLTYNQKASKLTNRNTGLIYIDVKHNTPDFSLAIVDENDKITYLMIADAKCRSFEDIIHFPEKANPYHDTLVDYQMFRYALNTNYLKAKSVDDLVFVCPEEDEPHKEVDAIYGVTFINTSLGSRYDAFYRFLLEILMRE